MRALALVLLAGCTVSTGAALGGSSTPAAAPAAAAAPAPAAAPDAAPAAAPATHSPVPGGRPARGARTCDAAADHCLRPDTWFLDRGDRAVTVFWADGAWREWYGGTVVDGGPAHRTIPATFSDLAVGSRVVIFGPKRLPPSESEAYGTWRLETVVALDPDQALFSVQEGASPSFAADYTRIVVETRD